MCCINRLAKAMEEIGEKMKETGQSITDSIDGKEEDTE